MKLVKSFIFVLASILPFSSRAIVPCDINYTVQVFATRAVASEGGPREAIITFYINSPSPGLQISYSISGSASNGSDYETISNTITIPFNQTSAVLVIRPKADANVETDETVTIRALPGTCVIPDTTYGFATITIKDKDAPFENPAAPVMRWSSHQNGFINGCAISRDGAKIAAGSLEGSVFVYEAATGNLLYSIPAHSAFVNHVAFSPDNSLIASTSYDQTLKIWNAADGTPVRTFTHTSFLVPVVFGLDSKTVYSGGGNGFIRAWTIETGAIYKSFTGETAPIWALDISPDGTKLVSGSGFPENRVRLWNAAGGSIRSMTGHTADVWAVRFSPDGAGFASASGDLTAKHWNASTGQSRTFRGATASLFSIDYTPDGQYLVAGSSMPDNKLRFWRVADAVLAKTFSQDAYAVNFLRFNRGGSSFAYACDNGFINYARSPYPPQITINTPTKTDSGLNITWSGAGAPFQVQTRPNLDTPWANLGTPTIESTATIPLNGDTAFVRVQGQE